LLKEFVYRERFLCEILPPRDNLLDALAVETLLGTLNIESVFSVEIAGDEHGRFLFHAYKTRRRAIQNSTNKTFDSLLCPPKRGAFGFIAHWLPRRTRAHWQQYRCQFRHDGGYSNSKRPLLALGSGAAWRAKCVRGHDTSGHIPRWRAPLRVFPKLRVLHLGLAQSQYRDRVSKAIPFGKCASKCRRACGTFE